jgi:hypothetical protein
MLSNLLAKTGMFVLKTLGSVLITMLLALVWAWLEPAQFMGAGELIANLSLSARSAKEGAARAIAHEYARELRALGYSPAVDLGNEVVAFEHDGRSFIVDLDSRDPQYLAVRAGIARDRECFGSNDYLRAVAQVAKDVKVVKVTVGDRELVVATEILVPGGIATRGVLRRTIGQVHFVASTFGNVLLSGASRKGSLWQAAGSCAAKYQRPPDGRTIVMTRAPDAVRAP